MKYNSTLIFINMMKYTFNRRDDGKFDKFDGLMRSTSIYKLLHDLARSDYSC